jgi:hypothetical protein
MTRIGVLMMSLVCTVCAAVVAPVARAEDTVTYEVVSELIPMANVEYLDGGQRRAMQAVQLPWSFTVAVPDAVSPTSNGAELRVDWRQYRWPTKWVTVRIYRGARVLCESTLDIGDATCYGSTPQLA